VASATPTRDQERCLLRAKTAAALQDELGHVPSEEKVNEVFL
jgi:hypothetical protein